MLIVCKECGENVSDAAPTCPKCGVPNPAGLSSKLIITRKKAMTGGFSKIDIHIDEKFIGYLKNGDEAVLDITPGVHEVVAIFYPPAGDPVMRDLEISIGTGQSINLECGFNVLTGFYFK